LGKKKKKFRRVQKKPDKKLRSASSDGFSKTGKKRDRHKGGEKKGRPWAQKKKRNKRAKPDAKVNKGKPGERV